jgi:Flp pilus assembly pilin Flp
MAALARFLSDESGATSVEYGLIAVCISVAIVTVLQGVAVKVGGTFGYVDEELR